ncbi:hypothetical protein D3C80_843810 [compost metagenome]
MNNVIEHVAAISNDFENVAFLHSKGIRAVVKAKLNRLQIEQHNFLANAAGHVGHYGFIGNRIQHLEIQIRIKRNRSRGVNRGFFERQLYRHVYRHFTRGTVCSIRLVVEETQNVVFAAVHHAVKIHTFCIVVLRGQITLILALIHALNIKLFCLASTHVHGGNFQRRSSENIFVSYFHFDKTRGIRFADNHFRIMENLF